MSEDHVLPLATNPQTVYPYARKNRLDAAGLNASFLPIVGGTVTGALNVNGNFAANAQAYVYGNLYLVGTRIRAWGDGSGEFWITGSNQNPETGAIGMHINASGQPDSVTLQPLVYITNSVVAADNWLLTLTSPTNSDDLIRFNSARVWGLGVKGSGTSGGTFNLIDYTFTPAQIRLQVNGNGSTTIFANTLQSTTDFPTLLLYSATNSDNILMIYGNRQWGVGVKGTGTSGVGDFIIVDYTTDSSRVVIDTSGNVSIGGNLVIGGGITSGPAGITSGGTVQGGYVVSTGDITASGYVHCSGVANSGVMTCTSITASGTITASGEILSNTDLRTAGMVYLGSTGTVGIKQVTNQVWTDQTTRTFGILPTADNNSSCGLSGTAWAQVASYWMNTVSDARLKHHIRIPEAGALDKVLALTPVEYHWRETEKSETSPYHYGFLADNVRRVMGDDFAGWREENGVQGLSYDELTAVLWQAVQELAAEVAELKPKEDK